MKILSGKDWDRDKRLIGLGLLAFAVAQQVAVDPVEDQE